MTVYFWRIYLNSFFVFFQWFELCFQESFLVAKKSTFEALFHPRGSFWSHFWLSFGSFVRYFGNLFVLGRTLGALGANFFITKTVWTTKGAPVGFPPKSPHFFGAILRSDFVIFSVF